MNSTFFRMPASLAMALGLSLAAAVPTARADCEASTQCGSVYVVLVCGGSACGVYCWDQAAGQYDAYCNAPGGETAVTE
jgi:hypothetical protein